jgi:multidrug resistance efflux pump
MVMAKADLAAADGQIQQAKGAYEQALEELQMKEELFRRNPDIVPQREIERLRNTVEGRQGAVTAADAAKQAAETKLSTLLPGRQRRPAPKPPLRKLKSTWTRRWCAPG